MPPAPIITAPAFSTSCFNCCAWAEKFLVDLLVCISENIKDHLLDRGWGLQEVGYSFNRDFGGFPVGKVELPGGNTAERHARQSVYCRQFQTGTVAGCQFFPVPGGNMSLDNGADGVQNILGREVIPFCQLGPACGFRAALALHDLITFVPQLEACC